MQIMIEVALYQPDIAGNVGTIARTCACFGLPLTIIEPAGFLWNDSKLRRAGMDYLDFEKVRRMPSWSAFKDQLGKRRLVLLTTKSSHRYLDFRFVTGDILLLGRESAGVPEEVHASVEHRIAIPMRRETRSLNVAIACGIVAAEAMRQLQSEIT
jgi:tRNA (cytidine/uridine-2'-O-)-methyltransferase